MATQAYVVGNPWSQGQPEAATDSDAGARCSSHKTARHSCQTHAFFVNGDEMVIPPHWLRPVLTSVGEPRHRVTRVVGRRPRRAVGVGVRLV